MHLGLADIASVFAPLGVAVAVVVVGLAERTPFSGPIVLVLVGLGLSQVPGVPDYGLNPGLVPFFFLPPLPAAAARQSSVRNIRDNVQAITRCGWPSPPSAVGSRSSRPARCSSAPPRAGR